MRPAILEEYDSILEDSEAEAEVLMMEAEAASAEAEARATAIEEALVIGEVVGPAEEVAAGVVKPRTKPVGSVNLWERIIAVTGEQEDGGRHTAVLRRPLKAEEAMNEQLSVI